MPLEGAVPQPLAAEEYPGEDAECGREREASGAPQRGSGKSLKIFRVGA